MNVLSVDQAGFDFIAGNEGYTPVPKVDGGGRLVWGHGHDQQPGETPPDYISPSDSDALLWTDLHTRYEPQVNMVLSHLSVDPGQNQYNCFADFCYNLGPGDLHEMLRHGEDQVPNHILLYKYVRDPKSGIMVASPGLLARRERELALFQTP